MRRNPISSWFVSTVDISKIENIFGRKELHYIVNLSSLSVHNWDGDNLVFLAYQGIHNFYSLFNRQDRRFHSKMEKLL